jgi:hypothetical protein
MSKYTVEGQVILLDGVRVLECTDLSHSGIVALANEYQNISIMTDEGDPNFKTDHDWTRIRKERDALLTSCDWTQLLDAPLTLSERNAWSEYRQTLRVIPQTFTNPDEVVWPEVPNG